MQTLDHILLGLLREPASGWDLRASFEDSARHFWSAELSQIYPTLQRLERKGLLTSTREPSPKGPPRRVYARTTTGQDALATWLDADPITGTERFAYLAQLFFMGEGGSPERTETFLTKLRDRLAGWRDELAAGEAAWRAEANDPDFPDSLPDDEWHVHLSLTMGITSLGAKVAWCEQGLASLRRRRAQRTTASPKED